MVSWLDITMGGDQFRDAIIGIENTVIVNNTFEFNFMYFTIPLGLISAVLNMSVLMMLWKKETTVVNQLMTIDCIMNILSTSLSTFQQSPYYRGLDVEVYCYINLILAMCCMVFNRLCPVAIVVFR